MALDKMNSTTTPDQTHRDLEIMFYKWGITEWGVWQFTRQGWASKPAMVWYVLNGQRMEMPSMQYTAYQHNLRAIYLTLEGLRLSVGRGTYDLMRQHFAQLPAAGESSAPAGEDAYAVLGITTATPLIVAEAAWRTLAKAAHPDAEGSERSMRRLNDAIAAVRRDKQATP